MAKASLEIIEILRRTASRIETSADYQWGHMGSCNCGFLVQEVTHLKKDEIHARALQRFGDWNEQLNDYCPSSGLPIDNLIHSIIDAGFDTDDLKHLEKLSDPAILQSLPEGENTLRFNVRSDVVIYLRAWAQLTEQEIALASSSELRAASRTLHKKNECILNLSTFVREEELQYHSPRLMLQIAFPLQAFVLSL